MGQGEYSYRPAGVDRSRLDYSTGERGEVKSIGMRNTKFLTLDGVLITISNSVITNAKIVNESAPYQYFRTRLALGVAYGSDLELVEKVLTDVAATCELLRTDPLPLSASAPMAICPSISN